MKKFLSNANPFILILIPVLFALLMGVSYQFEQKATNEVSMLSKISVKQSTSLFYKSVSLVKTVCSVAQDIVW
jgi:cytochrome c biogenesis protein CcdA